MDNLRDETEYVLEYQNLSPTDVLWVGSLDGKLAVTWAEFTNMAHEYDSGYGAQEVATDFVVVGKDWWLSRHEYDGSESWTFHRMPVKHPQAAKFGRCIVITGEIGWLPLAKMLEGNLLA